MTDRLTILGGGVASLAAALVAARAGRRVDLLLDPERLGGSFGGVQAGARRLDLGVRLFELDYERSASCCLPIRSFDPTRHTHRPFIADIAAFIRSILPDTLRRAAAPEMWINGARTRCPLMTVDLTDFPGALTATDRRLILDELHALAPPQEHDTLDAASLGQHGARLHALLTEAVCAKQFQDWRTTMPSERRKLWAALFHPRTLLEAFTGGPIGFRPHRPFFTTASGAAHPFITRLFDAVAARPDIAIVPVAPLSHLAPGPGGTMLLRFGAAPPISLASETTVIGLPPEPLFAAAGIPYAPQRVTASVLWVDVPERDVVRPPSTLLLADPALEAFRVSAAGSAPTGEQTFTIEFGAAVPSLEAARAALLHTGVIRDGARLTEIHRLAGPAQTAPIPASRTAFTQALDRFRAQVPGATILGAARRFGWDSLNDQITDALHFGATRC